MSLSAVVTDRKLFRITQGYVVSGIIQRFISGQNDAPRNTTDIKAAIVCFLDFQAIMKSQTKNASKTFNWN